MENGSTDSCSELHQIWLVLVLVTCARYRLHMAFEIVIGTVPKGSADLGRDVELLKPALIYGDRIRLISPTAAMLQGIAGFAYAEGEQRVQVLRQAFEAWGPEKLHEVDVVERVYTRLKRTGKKRTKEELQALMSLESTINGMFNEIQQKVEQMLIDAKADELASALETGLVEIEPLLETEQPGIDFTDEMINTFIAKLHDVLIKGQAFPLFDDETGNVINLQVKEGVLVPNAVATSHGKQIGLASGLLSALPAFPRASVSEVIDIRDELRDPLVRFRAGVSGMATTIDAASFEPDFAAEVDDVFHRDVAPALMEIKEAIQANSNLRQLTRAALTDASSQIVGVLSLGVASQTAIPELAALGAGTVAALARAAWQQKEEAEKIQQHQMYLLHRSEELLAP